MKKLIGRGLVLSVLTSLFLVQGTSGQGIGEFSFTQDIEAYSTISGTAAGLTGDDVVAGGIGIGFPFYYCGYSYSTVTISTNGWVVLGTTALTSYSNYLSTTSLPAALCPLWDDFYAVNGTDIQYQTTGTSPYRVFTVQWGGGFYHHQGTVSNTYSFQLKLFETSNQIKFCYGPISFYGSGSGSIGLIDQTGGSGHFISVSPGNPATTSMTSANNSISTFSNTNLVYTFSPPTPVQNAFSSCNLTQNTDLAVPGSVNQPIIGIQINTTGTLGPFLETTGFTFHTNGSTNPADILQARVYFSGISPTFSTAVPFGSVVALPDGQFQVTGSQVLDIGANYFWLTYDLSSGAMPGNSLDAECAQISFTGAVATPVTPAPSGNRLIYPYTIAGVANTTSGQLPIYSLVPYSSSECLYTAAEVSTQPIILRTIGWYKSAGEFDNLDHVKIYLKTTSETSIDNSVPQYDLSEYSLVYSGNYPNYKSNGWHYVSLTNPFLFDGTSNLKVLVLTGPINVPFGLNFAAVNIGNRARYGQGYTEESVNLMMSTWGLPIVQFGYTIPGNMQFETCTAAQPISNPAGTGWQNVAILRVNLVTDGVFSPLIVNAFHFETEGSSQPTADIGTARLYSTGADSSFSTNDLIGSVTEPNGAFTITPAAQVNLAYGANFFWLAYDITPTATPGHVLDARLTGVEVADTLRIPVLSAPTGNRPILQSMCGNYTIDPGQPPTDLNFTSIQSAKDELYLRGVGCPVLFAIAAGTYTGALNWNDSIPGASEVNTITFQSATADSSSVVISYTTTGSTDNFVMNFQNVGHLVFQHLTFQNNASASLYSGVVLQLGLGCHSLHFSHNRITRTPTNLNLPSRALVYGSMANSVSFSNNRMENGDFAFYLTGTSSSLLQNISIEDNRILNPSGGGIQVQFCNASLVRRNFIQTNNAYSGFYGIYGGNDQNGAEISGNQIFSTAGHGIGRSNCTGTTSAPALIFNNFISIGGTGNSYGLQLDNSSWQIIGYNTVNLYSTGLQSQALRVSGNTTPTGLQSLNNILLNTGGGYAVYVQYSTTALQFDRNNYFSTGTNLGYWGGTSLTSLASWKSTTSLDANSLGFNPSFMANGDYHVDISGFNGLGQPIPGITTDIEGNARDATHPDPGCVEFSPQLNHYYSSTTSQPLISTVISGTANNGILLINIRTHGDQTPYSQASVFHFSTLGTSNPELDISSATLYACGNSPGFSTANPIGSFSNPTGDFDIIPATPYALAHGDNYFWLAYDIPLSAPSLDGVDASLSSVLISDTSRVPDVTAPDGNRSILAPFCGTYTINPSLPPGPTNFQSFSATQAALELAGVACPVTILVSAGTYTEQLNWANPIPGTSETNTVTFRGATNDSTSAILQFPGTSSNNYVLRFSGANYMAFKYLTVKSTASTVTNGQVVVLSSGSHHISLSHNRITGLVHSSNSGSSVLTCSSSSPYNQTIIINQNRIENGTYGIFWGVYGTNVAFDGNVVTNQYTGGIKTSFGTSGVSITSNQITSTSIYSSYVGISIAQTPSPIISGNKIVFEGGSNSIGLQVSSHTGTAGNSGKIFNNFVATSLGWKCISIENSTYLELYHNNLHNLKPSGGYCIHIQGSSTANITLKNNILTAMNGGMPMASSVAFSTFTSDYNDFYKTGTYMFQWGSSFYSSLSAWRSATSKDMHSLSLNPLYTSNTDLHISQIGLDGAGIPISWITTDIDGEVRDPVHPDIGADEVVFIFDAAVVAIPNPASGCGLGQETVSLRISNPGNQTIQPGNLSASYIKNNGSPVTENINLTLNPGDTVLWSFSTLVDLTALTGNTTFNFKGYVHLVNDNNPYNDTLWLNNVFSGYSYPAPAVTGQTVNCGQTATLGVTLPAGTIPLWYDQPSGGMYFNSGSSGFTTPVLCETTPYFVEVVEIQAGTPAIGTENQVISTTWCNPYGQAAYQNRNLFLIRAEELQNAGIVAGPLSSLAFNVVTPTSAIQGHNLDNFSIRMVQTSLDHLSSDSFPSSGFTTVYSVGNFTTVAGWNTHTFSTPFNWDGVSNLVIRTCFDNYSYTSVNATLRASSTPFVSCLGDYSIMYDPYTSCSSNFGFDIPSSLRPNMRLGATTLTCHGTRAQVTAQVTGSPLVEVSENCLHFTETVQHTSNSLSLTITNTGNYLLRLDSLRTLLPVFSTADSSYALFPGDSVVVSVVFAPEEVGPHADTLFVYNNDELVKVCLTGTCTGAPLAEFSPLLIEGLTGCAGILSLPFSLLNQGLDTLIWSVSGITSECSNLTDHFDQGWNTALWESIGGGLVTDTCSPTEENLQLWFNSGPRIARTVAINTVFGGTISFTLEFGSGNFPCEEADNGDNVVLEYSINGGSTWFTISTFLPEAFYDPVVVNLPVPFLAKTPATQFRFRQVNYASTGFDNWTLDDVVFLINRNTGQQISSGSLAPGDSMDNLFFFEEPNLLPGTYSFTLTLATNDPLHPNLAIPIQVTANGTAQLTLSENAVSFGNTLQFGTTIHDLFLDNSGCDTLIISEISCTSPEISFSPSSLSLLPGQIELLPISYSPQTPGAFSGELTFQTNQGTVNLPLTGVCDPVPIIQWSPDVLNLAPVVCSQTLTTPIQVSNTGFAPLIIQPKYPDLGKCLRFGNNFTNSYVSLQTNTLIYTGTPWTMEAWVYPQVMVPGRHTIAGRMDGSSQSVAICLQNGYFGFCVKTQEDGPVVELISDTLSFAGRWYHVAAVLANGVIHLYVNGHFQKAAPVENISLSNQHFYIGSEFSNSSNFFIGLIDEIAVWHKACSQYEIQSHRFKRLQGTETNLVALWNFEEGFGSYTYNTVGTTPIGVLTNTVWVDQSDPPGGFVAMPAMVDTLLPGETANLPIWIDPRGLTGGLYQTSLLLETNDPSNLVVTIPVNLLVPSFGEVNAGPDTTLWAGQSVLFNATHTGTSPPFQYTWHPPSFLNDPALLNPSATPPESQTYHLIASNAQGCFGSDDRLVTVLPLYSISGQVSYDNILSTPLNNVTLFLNSNSGSLLETVVTNSLGYYQFQARPAGSFQVRGQYTYPFGGINATDALAIQRHIVGLQPLTTYVRTKAADLNNSGSISSADALLVMRRTVGLINNFAVGDWIFSNPNPTTNYTNLTENVKALCAGDVNGSYPLSQGKDEATLALIKKEGEVGYRPGESFDLPVFLSASGDIGAITLHFSINEGIILNEIIPFSADALVNQTNDGIWFGWFQDGTEPLDQSQPLFVLNLQSPGRIDNPVLLIREGCEIADPNANPLQNAAIIVPETTAVPGPTGILLGEVHPNPFQNSSTFDYYLDQETMVNIAIVDMVGKMVAHLQSGSQQAGWHTNFIDANGLESGPYFLLFRATRPGQAHCLLRKLSIIK